MQAYFRRYGEKANRVLCGRMSKVLADLEREYDAGQVLGRFKRYLDRTAPEFFSPWHFAQTWPAWAPPVDGPAFLPYHPVSNERRYLTADELDAKAGIPLPPDAA